MAAPASYKSKKVLRNCMHYELGRTSTKVIHVGHYSSWYVWETPIAIWDALP